MTVNVRWYVRHAISLKAVDIIRISGLAFSPGVPAAAGYEVSVVHERDIPELMEFHDSRCVQRSNVFTREEARVRLDSGWLCFCTRYTGSMAGFVWFAPRTISSADLHCEFDMDEASVMITNGFVASEHRGRSVFPMLMNESFRELARLGYDRMYGFVRHNNRPSKSALAKHHYRTFGIIVYGFVMGVYFFLPSVRKNAGIRVRLCASPWHRWQAFFRKRMVREGALQ